MWRRLANRGYPWWRRWSRFSWELRQAFGKDCQIREFRWSGANTHEARIKAGAQLAREIAGVEPERKVHFAGHSHGGNVALAAVNQLPPHRVALLILLANPNLVGVDNDGRKHWLYWGTAAERVERIWNIYSPQDIVQCSLVRRFHGVPHTVCKSLAAARVFAGAAADRIRNGEIPWSGRFSAHSAMHSAAVGTVVGALLRGADFKDALTVAGLSAIATNPVRDRGGWPGMVRAQAMIRAQADPAPFDLGDAAGGVGLLFIHGFTASPTEMRPMASFIKNATGWRCAGPLLPGHGSRIEDLRYTRGEDWVAAVEKAYATLSQDCSQVFLVGLSMGAVLACHVALRRSGDGKLRGVILLAPAFGVRRWRSVVVHLLGPLGYASGKTRRAADYFLDNRLFTYLATPLDRAADVIRLGREASRSMSSLRDLPVMMATGDRESTVSLQKMLTVAAENPWIQLVRLPRSRHIVTVEPDAELLFEHSLRFVKECLRTR
jgi:carboxylesterase